MKHGTILESFLQKLNSLGYHTQLLLLKAEEFCVPQRRRRVFILGNRNEALFEKPKALLSAITHGRTKGDAKTESSGFPPPISVSEAIGDLPQIKSGGGEDAVSYDSAWLNSDYQRYMRGMISLESLLYKRAEQG
jgi:DNA (cytosine-5)-methyltransferase 1